jgi:hypothetical protein
VVHTASLDHILPRELSVQTHENAVDMEGVLCM